MQGNVEKNIPCYYLCSFTLWYTFSATLVRSSKFYYDLLSCLISRSIGGQFFAKLKSFVAQYFRPPY